MRDEILNLLACPAAHCRGELRIDTQPAADGGPGDKPGSIKDASPSSAAGPVAGDGIYLVCRRCARRYAVLGGLPHLIPEEATRAEAPAAG